MSKVNSEVPDDLFGELGTQIRERTLNKANVEPVS